MCPDLQRSTTRRGFTLTELSVGVAVSSIILTALLSFTVYAAKSFVGMYNYVDLEQRSQLALDTITRDVRQTLYVTNYTTRVVDGKTVTNSVTFLDSDNQILTFVYTNDVLLREKAGVTTMLLTNVDFLTFNMFQRNPTANSWDQYELTTASPCKVLSVTWVCSRNILGSKMNTESVQTAKIVIRKQ
jgi:prepilin-type N-terminal cleavage/methylation domain-containing protein